MNLEITRKEQLLIIEGLGARIEKVEKLILTFQNMTLIEEYINDRNLLVDLKNRLLNL